MNTKTKIESWHQRLAEIVGQVSLALVRRKVSGSAMSEWAAKLRRIAKEMDDD